MQIESLKVLHDLGASYWQVCVLHTAVKLKVFTHLGRETLDVGRISECLQTEPRATELFLNAVASLGLLVKENGRFRNTGFAVECLDETSPNFMGNIIYHMAHMYQDWGRLEDAVRTGKPVTKREDRTDETSRQFLLGMHNLAVRGAEVLVRQMDLSPYRSMLDLGGGPGTYALSFCRQNPQLSAVIFDLPDSEKIAAEKIASFQLGDRVRFSPGDFHKDRLPDGPFDLVFMSHILHGSSVEKCASLIERVYPVTKPGGEVIIQEFVLNEEKTAPAFAVMFSLNMLLHTPGGRSFSFGEMKGWLETAGFVDVAQVSYDGLPNDASLVRAARPR